MTQNFDLKKRDDNFVPLDSAHPQLSGLRFLIKIAHNTRNFTVFVEIHVLGGFCIHQSVMQYSNVTEYSNLTEYIVHELIMKHIKFYYII
jgi:hypothetical protein